MRPLSPRCAVVAALLCSAAAWADDSESTEAEANPTADRPLLWDKEKAPSPDTFIDEGADGPVIGAPGPWDLHPEQTPVVAGPWSVERPGTAPNGITRDGSAREPEPPKPQWGASTGDPEDEDPSPWNQAQGKSKVGVEPLGAHFPVRILGHEPDALLIELPMVVAQSPDSFEGPGFWLIVEFFIDAKKVGDHRLMVTKETLATMGPTHAWVKSMVPTPRPHGVLTIRVLKLNAETNEIQPMFQRKVRFGK